MPEPFSLHIFVKTGDPDGVRIVERTNWNGKAVVFPRSEYPQVRKRGEFEQAGIYMLVGPRERGEGDALYIGEGDPVGPRLDSHYAQKDFWPRAVVVVAGPGSLNKAHVQFLEAKLIRDARKSKRMQLENANQPNEPSLSEADQANMKVFLGNMMGMLPILGVDAFELQAGSKRGTGRRTLYCRAKGVEASGFESNKGFAVIKGSEAVRSTVPSMEQYVPSMYNLREELIATGVLKLSDDRYTFSQDYDFNSPSTAAAVILGRSANGRLEWKTSDGKTLKSLQEASA